MRANFFENKRIQDEEEFTTKTFLEKKLREKGLLMPDEELALHEAWEIVDLLKKRWNAIELTEGNSR